MTAPDAPPTPPQHPTLQALALPALRAFALGQLASMLAHSLLRATLAWHVWKATGSYALLGTLGLVEFLPVIPCSLIGGALADSADRRRVVATTLAASMLLSLGLALSVGSASHEELAILALAFLLAVASAFQRPSYSALLPSLVPVALFPSATVINANVRNVALVSGPVLMGFVTRAWGLASSYLLCALLFGAAAGALLRVPEPKTQARRGRVSWAAVREGIAFVRSRAVILSSMMLDMFAVIFAGATALLPVFADEVLGVGEVGYGWLSASLQIGTLSMALLLLWLPPLRRPGRALLWAVVVYGAASALFGVSRSFPLSMAAFIVAGMADQVSMTARSILVQLSTPDELRGRVSSVNMIFIGASNELGAAESGYLAALTSATFSVVFGGLACIGVAAVAGARVPALRRYRTGESST